MVFTVLVTVLISLAPSEVAPSYPRVDYTSSLTDLRHCVIQKTIISYDGMVRDAVGGVCKSRRLSAARTYHNSNGPPSRFPSLMLIEKSNDQKSRELFLLSNKSIRKIQLPQAYDKAVFMWLANDCGIGC
ncbi:hypothetical protein Tco_1513045 [Tanacetum coccineum]